MVKEKVCNQCGKSKLLSEFYKNPRSKSGLFAACKPCVRERSKNWQNDNPDAAAEHRRRSQEAFRTRRPDNHRATEAVRYSLKTDKLQKPKCCEMCDQELPLEAHHHDYTKPSDVTWLCKRCHTDEHVRLREVAGCFEETT